jgi:hypothetical protein
VAYAINRILLYGAILIGYFVAGGVLKGTGKVTRFGQVIIPILTVASVLFGDAIFYTLAIMKHEGAPFYTKLLGAVLSHLWEIESEGGGVLTILFAAGRSRIRSLCRAQTQVQGRVSAVRHIQRLS